MSGRRLATVVAGLLALAQPWPSAQAHAGGPTTRPVLSSVEPVTAGLTVRATFVDNWRIQLNSDAPEPVSVLDTANRPFLRFSRAGVEADFGSSAWRDASVMATQPTTRADNPPDWRLVSRRPTWSWLDPRIRPEPGLLTQKVLSSNLTIRLRDFEIPLRVSGQPGRITGYLRYEPPTGTYRLTIVSSRQPVAGLHVGEILGRAAPTLTLDNETGKAVTVLGRDGEPLARLSRGSVEANLASPTWVDVGRSLGFLPAAVPEDPGARWERILEGRRWSWADYRSAPTELPPPFLARVVANHKAVLVKRWVIPLQVESRRLEIRGVTHFVPAGAVSRAGANSERSRPRLKWRWWEPAASGLIFMTARPREDYVSSRRR
jgi:hypothetical protein